MTQGHKLRTDENQLDQGLWVQARRVEQLYCSTAGWTCAPTFHHPTRHLCRQLWALMEELVVLYIICHYQCEVNYSTV